MWRIKCWLEEDDDLETDHHLFLFKFIQLKAQNWHRMLSPFSHSFITNSKPERFCIPVISNNKNLISQNLNVLAFLERKLFSPSGFEFQSKFDYNISQIKFYSILSELLNAIWTRRIWCMILQEQRFQNVVHRCLKCTYQQYTVHINNNQI